MKKLAALLAIVSVAVLAAPALSATNPFMDVPMNHWAYDAIGQLAAHGILSGYPDGLYKGRQATTRYEMASALARALAVVDMTKASKQDVEMLKRLVVEFKDELEALGVRVDELDQRVAVLEDRLGGWHIHGALALDVTNRSKYESPNPDTTIDYDDLKLFIERRWGENDEYFFMARFADEGGASKNAVINRFFVEMPFFGDTRLTVGRFSWNWGAFNKIPLPETGSWTGGALLTDWEYNGFGLTKNFGIGQVQAVLAHPNRVSGNDADAAKDVYNRKGVTMPSTNTVLNGGDWMFMARGSFKFTERVGLDLGGQIFIGDNEDTRYQFNPTATNGYDKGDITFKNLWTVYAALNFNFTENIAFRGVFYHQDWKMEQLNYYPSTRTWSWDSYRFGNHFKDGNHWAVMFDVKQEALKFTSLWLEYGQFDEGFTNTKADAGRFFYSGSDIVNDYYTLGGIMAAYDIKYWRIALGQQWTDKIATHIFYYGYNVKNGGYTTGNGKHDAKPKEIGVGVQYKLNDYTTMGINYVHVDNDYGKPNAEEKDNIVRFRTSISF